MPVQSQVHNKHKPITKKTMRDNLPNPKSTLAPTDVFGIAFIELSYCCGLLTFFEYSAC